MSTTLSVLGQECKLLPAGILHYLVMRVSVKTQSSCRKESQEGGMKSSRGKHRSTGGWAVPPT